MIRKIVLAAAALGAAAALVIGIAPSASAATPAVTITINGSRAVVKTSGNVVVDSVTVTSNGDSGISKDGREVYFFAAGSYRVTATVKYRTWTEKAETEQVEVETKVKTHDAYYTDGGSDATGVNSCTRTGDVRQILGWLVFPAACTTATGDLVTLQIRNIVGDGDITKINRLSAERPVGTSFPAQVYSGGWISLGLERFSYTDAARQTYHPATYETRTTIEDKPTGRTIKTYSGTKTATKTQTVTVSKCEPGYDKCLDRFANSDYDCSGSGGNGPGWVYEPVKITGNDPYGLDADHDGWGCEELGSTPNTSRGSSAAHSTKITWKSATVKRWIDGDTVVTTKGTIRLIGVDTPEKGRCGASTATKWANKWAPKGSTIKLGNPKSVSDKDKYGRSLRYVTKGKTDVSKSQIVKGAQARYDSTDGYQWHPRQSSYHKTDQTHRDYTC